MPPPRLAAGRGAPRVAGRHRAPRSTARFGIPDTPAARRWALVAVVDSLGTGLVLPIVVLYFSQQVGLTPEKVALGIGIAGTVGSVLVPAGGVLADRVGPKRIVVTGFTLAGVGSAGYLFVGDLPELVCAVVLAQLADGGARPAKQAFVALLVDGESRARLLAFNRSVRNAGYGVGGMLSAVAVGFGHQAGYHVLIAANALSFLAAAVLVGPIAVPARQPAPASPAPASPAPASPTPRRRGGFREVLRDRRYVLLAALNSLVLLHGSAFVIAMPLWVAKHTAGPDALVGVLFAANTAFIVLFQVRATKGLVGPADAPPAYRAAALAMVSASGAYAAAYYAGPVPAIALLVTAVVLHSGAELFASAAEWTVSIGLAPEELRGRYLSLYTVMDSAQRIVGPVTVTLLVTRAGPAGWLVIGAVIAAACLTSGALVVRHPHARGSAPLPPGWVVRHRA